MIKGFILGVLATLILGIAVWLSVAYTGIYNVAASDPHADVVRWTLETGMRRSVASRADEVTLPETFSQERIVEGGRHYAESCVQCHGAPGEDPAQWSRGMRPEPPHLVEAATEWSPEEIYWIVENGIRMTGMPAMGGHHSPEDIVALTAFVEALPGLTAEDYQALAGPASRHGGHHSSGAAAEPEE